MNGTNQEPVIIGIAGCSGSGKHPGTGTGANWKARIFTWTTTIAISAT